MKNVSTQSIQSNTARHLLFKYEKAKMESDKYLNRLYNEYRKVVVSAHDAFAGKLYSLLFDSFGENLSVENSSGYITGNVINCPKCFINKYGLNRELFCFNLKENRLQIRNSEGLVCKIIQFKKDTTPEKLAKTIINRSKFIFDLYFCSK